MLNNVYIVVKNTESIAVEVELGKNLKEMAAVLFCAVSIVPIKRFGLSFERIFQYWLLLCGKLYAEH